METNTETKMRKTRRTLEGAVVRDGMSKTIAVRVERLFKHTKYKKYIRRHSKYLVHDEQETAKIGDRVKIAECRPLSKTKRWRLVGVVGAAVESGPVAGEDVVETLIETASEGTESGPEGTESVPEESQAVPEGPQAGAEGGGS